MAMLCPLCRSRYDHGARTCPHDGMELVTRDDPVIGRLVDGRYRILEQIGAGGVCLVYKVIHEPSGEPWAMKILPQTRGADATLRARFLREATLAARLDHPNIIRVSELGETPDGLVFMVMELLPGPTLSEVIERGALPQSRVLKIGWQIARGLARAHDLGVVHRDVKSDNIMFVSAPHEADHVKLLDFGLAATIDAHRLTATGQLFGTPEYLSPERTTGGKATSSSDLYSLGVVIYEMLTGRLPFQGDETQMMRAHLESTPLPPSRAGGPHRISLEADALVLKLLAKEPRDRHRNAHHLVDELAALLANPPELSPAQPRGAVTGQSPRLADRDLRATGARMRLRKLEAQLRRRSGPHPNWLEQALTDMLPLVQEVASLEAQLGEVSKRRREQEVAVRRERERLGNIVSVLSRDESLLRHARRTAEPDEQKQRDLAGRLDGLRDRISILSTQFEHDATQLKQNERDRSEQLCGHLARIDELATRLERYFQSYKPVRHR